MKLAFLFVGGQKEEWLAELASDYEKKLRYFCPTEIIRIKPSKQARGSSSQKLADETVDLLKQIKKEDLLIVCDEKGEQLTSPKFSAKLVKSFERGKPRVVILVGGAFGFGPELSARADWTWSLSTLVFNHHIAQAVVLEQTYRAFAIWKNLPYHNE
jgi:23S rRNA (pseudouridine1915-N3)-methyltransferase